MLGVACGSAAQAQKPTPAAQAAGAAVTGRNVTSVNVAEGANRAGGIRKVEGNRWTEFDAAGQGIADYEEARRDDKSVFIVDHGRGVTLQIDVRARKVTYLDAAGRRRVIYEILSSDASSPDPRGGGSPGRALLASAPAAPAFCINDAVTRGTGSLPGRAADCPAGYMNSGGVCKRAADTIAAPSRAAECPAGYSGKGQSCERPAVTKANTNSRPADCPEGFNNSGSACFRLSAPAPLPASSMTCKAGETKVDGRCFKACDTGFTSNGASCVRAASTLGAESLTCKAGFQKSANGQRCVAECAAGYTNSGDACTRPADMLAAESMSCKAGEMRSGGRCLPAGGGCAKGDMLQGGVCHKACAPGFDGAGSLCVAQAPKGWLQCGTGSARDAQACGAAAFEPLASLKQAAVALSLTGPGQQAAMQKKFRDLNDAYSKARDLPQLKKGRDASDAQATSLPIDKMAAATSEEDMLRYAAQVASMVDLSGTVEASAYPKCSALFPSR